MCIYDYVALNFLVEQFFHQTNKNKNLSDPPSQSSTKVLYNQTSFQKQEPSFKSRQTYNKHATAVVAARTEIFVLKNFLWYFSYSNTFLAVLVLKFFRIGWVRTPICGKCDVINQTFIILAVLCRRRSHGGW